MRRTALVALTAFLYVGPLAAADIGSPEAAITVPAEALRTNNIVGLFDAMPAADRAKAEAEWEKNRTSMSPQDKAQTDEFLAKMLATDAVDQLVAQAAPGLAEFNPAETAGMLQMIGGAMAMQLAQNPETKDYAPMAQGLVMDIAGWLPTSGLNDPVKLKDACTHLVNAVKALEVSTADELAALDFTTLLTRSGKSLAEAKKTFTTYGLDVDGFLASLKITDVVGDGPKRAAKLGFTAFGKPYTMPVALVQKDGAWIFDQEAAMQTLAPLMGGMGMGGGGLDEM